MLLLLRPLNEILLSSLLQAPPTPEPHACLELPHWFLGFWLLRRLFCTDLEVRAVQESLRKALKKLHKDGTVLNTEPVSGSLTETLKLLLLIGGGDSKTTP